VVRRSARRRIAGLYSLVASCELNGINPIDYLADVLLRVDHHPAASIDQLLPDAWTPAD
jgi:transposase